MKQDKMLLICEDINIIDKIKEEIEFIKNENRILRKNIIAIKKTCKKIRKLKKL